MSKYQEVAYFNANSTVVSVSIEGEPKVTKVQPHTMEIFELTIPYDAIIFIKVRNDNVILSYARNMDFETNI